MRQQNAEAYIDKKRPTSTTQNDLCTVMSPPDITLEELLAAEYSLREFLRSFLSLSYKKRGNSDERVYNFCESVITENGVATEWFGMPHAKKAHLETLLLDGTDAWEIAILEHRPAGEYKEGDLEDENDQKR